MAGATKGRSPDESRDVKLIEDDKDKSRDRSEESLDDKARRDQQAGDVADDLADFA